MFSHWFIYNNTISVVCVLPQLQVHSGSVPQAHEHSLLTWSTCSSVPPFLQQLRRFSLRPWCSAPWVWTRLRFYTSPSPPSQSLHTHTNKEAKSHHTAENVTPDFCLLAECTSLQKKTTESSPVKFMQQDRDGRVIMKLWCCFTTVLFLHNSHSTNHRQTV